MSDVVTKTDSGHVIVRGRIPSGTVTFYNKSRFTVAETPGPIPVNPANVRSYRIRKERKLNRISQNKRKDSTNG